MGRGRKMGATACFIWAILPGSRTSRRSANYHDVFLKLPLLFPALDSGRGLLAPLPLLFQSLRIEVVSPPMAEQLPR